MTNDDEAFPITRENTDWGRGLTKREYFAAQALAGYLSTRPTLAADTPSGECWSYAELGEKCVRAADAVLKALGE